MILTATAAVAQPVTWSHFAGNVGGGGAIDGPIASARFYAHGIVKDSKGNIFFCDKNLHLIRKLSPSGEVSTFAGLAGVSGYANGTDARFNKPSAMTIDRFDNLLVADTWNNAIRKITPAGVVSTVAGGPGLPSWLDGNALSVGLYFPEGLAVDPNGVIYISNTENYTIRKVANGQMTTFAGSYNVSGSANGTGAAARFDRPKGMTIDPSGNLWVSSNGYIRKITTPGAVVSSVGSGSGYVDGSYSSARFNNPEQLAAAPNGDVFVTDFSNGKIRKITSTAVSTVATAGGWGLFYDGGDLLVATANFIQRVTISNGATAIIAGVPATSGYQDGFGSNARFATIYDMATDAVGNIYVADANNCTIRKVTPAGEVTTLAGSPGNCLAADGVGTNARIGNVQGIDVDRATGTVYIADTWSQLIRKITPDGTVTTIAGQFNMTGTTDGDALTQAKFYSPSDVLYMPNGDLWVCDNYNDTIRKISGGVVSTIAGVPNANLHYDGTGTTARFYSPLHFAVLNNDVYVTDSSRIRKITNPGMVVTTVAGNSSGPGDGCGSGIDLNTPWGLASNGTVLFTAEYWGNTVRRLTPSPSILCSATIGGRFETPGSEDGTNGVARFGGLLGVTHDTNGTLYVAEFNGIRKGVTGIADIATVTPASAQRGTTFNLNVNGTASNGWSWSIVTRPAASDSAVAQLSATNVRNPTFIADAAGRYTFALDAQGPTGASRTLVSLTATCTTPPTPAIAVTTGTNPSCSGATVTLDAGAGYSSYLWSTGETTRTITVTPAATTTYTVAGYQGSCASAQASHIQNVSTTVTAVNVTVSGPPNVCANGTSGTATAADTGGPSPTHQWGYRSISGGTITDINGQTATTYVITGSHFPGPGTYYLVTRALGCGSPVTSNEIAVTVGTPQPATITPSGPTAICAGGGVTLTANAGAGYLWSTGATSQSITVTQAGNYNVAVTDANNCTTTSADTAVTLRTGGTVPVISFGPESLCTNGASGMASVPNNYSIYAWSITNGELLGPTDGPTVGFRATTTNPVQLTINVTDAGGCSATANVSVPIRTLAAPVIETSFPELCENGSSAMAGVQGEYAAFSWTITNGELLGPTNGPTVGFRATTPNPVQLSVQVTDAGGCTALATKSVPIRTISAPVIETSFPALCENGASAMAGVQGDYTAFNWTITNGELLGPTNGPTVGFRATTPNPVQLSVQVTDAGGCIALATKSVPIRTISAPTIETSFPALCENGGPAMAGVQGDYAAFSWTIQNGELLGPTDGPTVSFRATTPNPVQLSVQVTDAGGCIALGSKSIPIRTISAPTIETSVPSMCENGTPAMAGVQGEYAAFSWTIQGGELLGPTDGPTVSFRATHPNTVQLSVLVTDAGGCTALVSKSIPIRTISAPTIETSAPSMCENGTPANAGVPDEYAAYSWTIQGGELLGPTDGPTVSFRATHPVNPVHLSVLVTDAGGCTALASKSIPLRTISAPAIQTDAPSMCENGAPANAGVPDEYAAYSWTIQYGVILGSANGATISFQATNPVNPVQLSVLVTDAGGCTALASKSIPIRTLPAPSIDTSASTVCQNGATATASVPANFSTYAWTIQNGELVGPVDGPSVTFRATTADPVALSVLVTDAGGCTALATKNVGVSAPPDATITANGSTAICDGGNVTLTAPDGLSYLWSNGATTRSITVNAAGSFFVTVTNATGCSATSSTVNVTTLERPNPIINALSVYTAETPVEKQDTSFTFCGPITLNVYVYQQFASYSWSTGATTPSIQVTQSGVYTVTVTDANGCTGTSTATITINNAVRPTVTASGPTSFCPGGSVTLTSSPAPHYNWSNGAMTQSITVTQPGEYSVFAVDANSCPSASLPVTVTVFDNPKPTITPAATTFCAGSSTTLSASDGAAWLWSNGATTQSISITEGGTFSVTVTNANGCTNTSDPVTITKSTATASITAGGPTTFCEGGSVTLTANVGSSYLWSNGATSQSITVSDSALLYVTVTNADGCQATSSAVQVTENPSPSGSINASGPTTFCAGGSVTLTATGGSSWLWSNGATTPSITVSATGNYSVTMTSASGCSSSAGPVAVTVNPLPSAAITPSGPTTFCEGGNVTLTASAGSSYLWSNGATTQSITVNASGNFHVVVTSASSCSAQSSPVTVNVNPLPAPTITPSGPTTFCAGGNVTLTASAGSSYLWSNGATTQSIAVNASGNYHVVVTNASGCSAQSSPVSVTVNPLPSATITPSGPTTFCEGGNVTLTASAGSSYLWSNGATTQSITVSASGSFHVVVTNANGCSAQSSPTTVTVNPLPAPAITPSGPTMFCQGGNVTLTASAGSSYLWSNGATTQSITVSASGSFHVVVTNANGCSAQSSPTTVTVNPLPAPTITPSGATTFCQGGSVILTASAGSSYLWSNGATTQAITVNASGNFHVTVTNANGCSAQSSSTTVTVNPLPAATITPSGPTTFCEGGNVTLTASAGSSWLWSNGATTQAITVSAAGSYHVTVTNANGCSAQSAPTVVSTNALPAATITPSGATTFCQGGNVTLTASAGSSWLWSNGATTQSISVTQAGNYHVVVTNANGCVAQSAPTSVTVNPLPAATITPSATTFCNGGNVTLTASAGSSWLWSNGATSQQITITNGGTFTVTVTSAAGCSAQSAPVTITRYDLPTATVSGSQAICPGGSATIQAALTGTGPWNVTWSDGLQQNGVSSSTITRSVSPSSNTTYTITAITDVRCSNSGSGSAVITVNSVPAQPSITAGGATTFCDGGSVQLTATAASGYLWSNGATTQQITVDASGTFTVQVRNAAGCWSVPSAPTTVTENPRPVVNAPTPATQSVRKNQNPQTINVTSTGGATYQWYVTTTPGTPGSGTAMPGKTQQSLVPPTNDRGTFYYYLRVTSSNGCVTNSAIATVTVT